MKVVILGAGNVANILGKKIKSAGHVIVQIFNRNLEQARRLAEELDCLFYTDELTHINREADIYVIAVKDSAIELLGNRLFLKDKLVVHTAGSVPKAVLGKVSSCYGVLYPVQSLRKGMNLDVDIPFLIDGKDDSVIKSIENFASSITKTIKKADDAERLKLHVAAVVVSNFSNHLYVLAEDYCQAEELDFNFLKPLIKETAERINKFSAREVQTGPALRNDIITLDKHLRALSAYPKLKYIYLKMTDSIINIDK